MLPAARAWRGRRPLALTVLNKKAGEPVAYIDHASCSTTVRVEFEAAFRQRVAAPAV